MQIIIHATISTQTKIAPCIIYIHFVFTSYNNIAQSGTIDSSFGDNGIVILKTEKNGSNFKAIALQPNGKIIVTGSGKNTVLTCRYKENGTLDSGFGKNGIVRTKLTNNSTGGNDVALQEDGRIVVAGSSYFNNDSSNGFVLRLLKNGYPDYSFGKKGVLVISDISKSFSISKVFIQPDGKILCIGNGANSSSHTNDYVLLRFTANGSYDSSFGKGGKRFVDFNQDNDYATCGILQPGGKLVVGGKGVMHSGIELCEVGKAGNLIQEFGTDGKAIFPEDNGLTAMTRKSNGNFVTAALDYDYNNFFMGFTSSGEIDSSYGYYGGLYIKFDFLVNALCTQSDDKVVGVGNGDTAIHLTVFRTLVNGGRDDSFGSSGYSGIQLQSFGTDVVLQQDNKVLACGYAWGSDNIDNGIIVRFKNDNSVQVTTAINKQNSLAGAGNNAHSALLNKVNIYPNPAKNNLHVEGLSSTKNTKLTVVDFMGNIKLQANANNSSYNFNIASLPAGNYLLKIEMNDEVVTKKFVKE